MSSEIVYLRAVDQQFSSINGDGQTDDAPGSFVYRCVNDEDLKGTYPLSVKRDKKEKKNKTEERKIVLPMSFVK